MSSILTKEYIPADERPYSQNELKYKRQQLYNKLRLSQTQAEHNKCGHFYKVRKNGKKESDIIENKCNDTGNCSVCWKLYKLPNNMQDIASNLIFEHSKCFFEKSSESFLSYEDLDLETTYYEWLYEDIENDHKHGNKYKNGNKYKYKDGNGSKFKDGNNNK